MATLERYNRFEELKNAEPVSKKKSSKETPGQKGFREFIELVRRKVVHNAVKKDPAKSTHAG